MPQQDIVVSAPFLRVEWRAAEDLAEPERHPPDVLVGEPREQRCQQAIVADLPVVSYRLDPTEAGTRLTLRHEGFTNAGTCAATAAGWETSVERLGELLGGG